MTKNSPLIDLADPFMWPNATLSYLITKNEEHQPEVVLRLELNTAAYGLEEDKAQVTEHLEVYSAIQEQLKECATFDFSILFGNNAATQELQYDNALFSTAFAERAIAYLTAVSNGNYPNYTVAWMERIPLSSGLLDLLPVVSPLKISVTTTIWPATEPGSNRTVKTTAHSFVQPVADDNNSLPLQFFHFDNEFDRAFSKPDALVRYKIACHGTGRQMQTWIVRLSAAEGNGLHVKQTGGSASFYAPAPLNNQYQSVLATVFDFKPGTAFGEGDSKETLFSTLDLDIVAKQYLHAIDSFPAKYALLANSAATEHVPDYVQNISALRIGLADKISASVTHLLESDDTSLLSYAKESWRRQLLAEVSGSYRFAASAQLPAEITNARSGGIVTVGGPLIADGDNAGMNVSDASIAGDGHSAISIFVVTDQSEDASGQLIRKAVWNITTLSVQLPEFTGDLTFIVPVTQFPGAEVLTMPELMVPLPLRSLPFTPTLKHQKATASVETGPPSVVGSRSWDYTMTYDSPTAAQDDTLVSIQFNRYHTQPDFLSKSNPEHSEWIQAVGQYVHAYPQIEHELSNLTTADQDADKLQCARYALHAFSDIATDLARTWPSVSDVSGIGRLNMSSIQTQGDIRLAIRESEQPQTGHLELSVLPDSVMAETISCHLNIEGYNASAVENDPSKSLYFRTNVDGGREFLLFKDRMSGCQRTLAITGLDLLKQHNAHPHVQFKRNSKLSQDNGGKWQTVNSQFVTLTKPVTFSEVLYPQLDQEHTIDIATLSSQPSKTLDAHINALFAELTAGVDTDTIKITLNCQYSYMVPPGLPVGIPVLLSPEMQVGVADCGKSQATEISAKLNEWLRYAAPSQEGAAFVFDATIHAEKATARMPLNLYMKDVLV